MSGVWSVLFPGRGVCRCADLIAAYKLGDVDWCAKCASKRPTAQAAKGA